MAALLQSNSNTSVLTSVAATFGASPTQGNLLIAVVTADIGVGSIAISGWTTGKSIAVGVAGGLIVFYKVAAIGESATVTATGTLATFMDLQIFEYDGIDNASPLDVTASTADGGSGVTSRSSGASGTLTQATELVFVAVGMAGDNGGGASWSNSYTARITTTHLITANLSVTATTSTSSTGSWTNSQRAAGVLLSFFGETGDSYGLRYQQKPRNPRINWKNPLTKKLVFDMPFFERGSTKTTDLVKQISGTLTNTPTWITDLNGSGIKFVAASSQYINLANVVANNLAFWTVEALIKTTTLPQTNGFIFYSGNNAGGMGLAIGDGGGSSGSKLEGLVGSIAWVNSNLTLTNGVFQHVVMIVNATAWRFFLNGTKAAVTQNNDGSGATAGKGTIGCNLDNSNVATQFFNGSIYYVRVWDRPLADQEVRSLYVNPWQIYRDTTKRVEIKN